MATTVNRWRPPSFLEGPERDFAKLSDAEKSFYKELDLAIRAAFENIYLLDNVVGIDSSSASSGLTTLGSRVTTIESKYVASTAAGKKIAAGVTSVTGSQTAIVTGLATVTEVVASIKSTVAINEWVTVNLNGAAGKIDLYVWRVTGVADTTPIASITARDIHWIAFGT